MEKIAEDFEEFFFLSTAKKSDPGPEPDPDPHQHEKWDPDPHQKVLDPPHWFKTRHYPVKCNSVG